MDCKVVLPEKVANKLTRIQKKYRDQIYVALKELEGNPFLGKNYEGNTMSIVRFV
jgi:mRNA-degrading endonuclease RelE of RelBE toxin-antitoxin system